MDNGLRVHGFPAESVTDGSVLVVKTHQYPPEDDKFHSAILLIRNPRDAILVSIIHQSQYARKMAGKQAKLRLKNVK